MRTLYFDCGMGAAGDMLTAALLELVPDPEGFLRDFAALGIPGVRMVREDSVKCGIRGIHVLVTVDGEEEISHDHAGGIACNHGHDHAEGAVHAHGHGDGDGTDCSNGHCHAGEPAGAHGHGDGDGTDCSNGHCHAGEPAGAHGHGDGDAAASMPGHCHAEETAHPCGHGHGDGTAGTHGHNHSEATSHVHHHTGLHDIEHLVRCHLALPKKVQDDIMAVFGLIAEAESHVHNVPVTDIHFHEVGTLDAVADITAVCMLMNRLAPEAVVVSPVHVGSGQVRCAHGILPVPAPATAYILKDVPIYGGGIRGELCTPTGAALLKHFATRFGDMPVMKTEAVGYGMGKKDFEAANCVRAFLGQTGKDSGAVSRTADCSEETAGEEDFSGLASDGVYSGDTVIELSCNLDDMTAEAMGFAMERLLEGGALEVYTVGVGMKKMRPGVLLTVLCTQEKREEMVGLLFRHTTTIGVREAKMARYILDRQTVSEQTPFGPVRRKDSAGYGISRSKYEYEDVARIAREQGMGLEKVYEIIRGRKGE